MPNGSVEMRSPSYSPSPFFYLFDFSHLIDREAVFLTVNLLLPSGAVLFLFGICIL
jgi:hypothetical protein